MQATLSSPYEAQIRELLDFLHSEFGITEEAPVRVLLGALLPLDGFRPPRLTLETDWLSRYFDTSAWFTLGGLVHPYSLGLVRAPGVYRRAAHVLAEANDRQQATGMASVFIEPDWQKPEKWKPQARQYAERYLAENLRVRVHQPKRIETMNQQEKEARTAKMQFLVRAILQPGLRSKVAPDATFPPAYAYWCELGLKLMRPWPAASWQWLSAAIAEVAVRNAALEGRGKTEAGDWDLAGWALGWQVPVWTTSLLTMLGDGHDRKRGAPFLDLKGVGAWERTLQFDRGMQVRGGEHMREEARRLEREGVLKYKAAGKEWRIGEPPTCCHALRVLEGKAFAPDSQEAVGPHQRNWKQQGSLLEEEQERVRRWKREQVQVKQ